MPNGVSKLERISIFFAWGAAASPDPPQKGPRPARKTPKNISNQKSLKKKPTNENQIILTQKSEIDRIQHFIIGNF